MLVNIFNKDYELYFSVKANKEIAKLCLEGSFDTFQKTLESKGDDELLDFMSNVAIILNKAAEQKNAVENGERPKKWEELGELTMDILDCISPVDFVSKVMLPSLTCITGDAEATVEVEKDEKNVENRE